jgi:hypothetical protein
MRHYLEPQMPRPNVSRSGNPMPSKTIHESWHPGSPTWPRIGSAFNGVTDDATCYLARIQLPAKRGLMNHLGSQSD